MIRGLIVCPSMPHALSLCTSKLLCPLSHSWPSYVSSCASSLSSMLIPHTPSCTHSLCPSLSPMPLLSSCPFLCSLVYPPCALSYASHVLILTFLYSPCPLLCPMPPPLAPLYVFSYAPCAPSYVSRCVLKPLVLLADLFVPSPGYKVPPDLATVPRPLVYTFCGSRCLQHRFECSE